MPRIRFFRDAGGRVRPLYRTKNILKVRKNTEYRNDSKTSSRLKVQPTEKDRFLGLVEKQPNDKKTESRQASKNLFQELKLQPTEKDRFLHLIEEQPNEIAATHLPPSHSGIVTAAALKFLPEHRLQRLFEITTSIMKNSGCLTMEPRDIAFGYSLMLGAGL